MSKVALCAIAKNENLYIREWVNWYKKLGVSKIFLYDNNDIDGEHFEDVISDYINTGFVEVIDVRGVEKGKVYDKDGVNLQPQCYVNCYKTKLTKFDWVCFFDVDEFLTFKNGFTLDRFLNQPVFNNYDTILIPWVNYDDNNLLFYENLPVMKRFTHVSNTTKNGIVKSIVRCNKKFNDKDKGINCLIHSFILNDKRIIKANGEPIKVYSKSNWYTLNSDQIKKSNAVLNHYKTKSTEEYIKRHLDRWWGTGKEFTDKGPRTREDIMEQYFIFCKDTPDKRVLFNNYNLENHKNKVIVNFTTWKDRDWCCEEMLTHFSKQTRKPDHIICWLSNDEYNGIIPSNIQKCLDKCILTDVMWVDKNIYGHKRWDAMKYFNNAYNIFIDDDLYYPVDFVEQLIKLCNKHDNKVVACYYGRSVNYNNGKRITMDFKNYPSFLNTLYSGLCCFPPNLFPLESFNYTNIRDKYSLRCDDSWVNGWLIKKKIKVAGYEAWTPESLKEIPDSKQNSVWTTYNSKKVNGTIQKYINLVNVFKILHIEDLAKKVWPNININKFATV